MADRGKLEDPRRTFLVNALAAGLAGAGALVAPGVGWAQARQLAGLPGRLPPGRSIYRMRGEVQVDGKPATLATTVGTTSRIETGASSQVVFAVGESAYLMRQNSAMQLEEPSVVRRSLRLFTGALLSVFGRRAPQVSTGLATIGIRGTGVYVEAEPDRSYVCTCYGITELASLVDPNATETIESTHHDAPRYLLAQPGAGALIQPAPYKNHDDEELALIEAIVGREPPFAVFGDGYGTPRRDSY